MPDGCIIRHTTGNTGAYTDCNGDEWAADQPYSGNTWGYVGGNSGGGDHSISNALPCATDEALYDLSERWGGFSYNYDVDNATYDITLKFAETWFGSSCGNGGGGGDGSRRFHVDIEGTRVLNDYDIHAEVGCNTAVDKSFTATVSDGVLNIDFVIGLADNPRVGGIEIVKQGCTVTYQSCNGGFWDDTLCSYGCDVSKGGCYGTCEDGEKRCADANNEEDCVDYSWVAGSACTYGSRLSSFPS